MATKKNVKTFKVKEIVIHKKEGVCEIAKKEVKDFGSGEIEYFFLKPKFPEKGGISTLMIPTSTANEVLRYPVSKNAVKEFLKKFNSFHSPWINNAKERKDYFDHLLLKGDLQSLAIIYRTILKKKEEYALLNRVMPLTDQNFIGITQKLLFQEIGVVLGYKDLGEVEKLFKK